MAMYLDPKRAVLLGEAPVGPPSKAPALDLLTEYVRMLVSGAAAGLVRVVSGGREFDGSAERGPNVTCSCGAVVPGLEFYVRDGNMRGYVLGPLAVHIVVFHRHEARERWGRTIDLLKDHATTALLGELWTMEVPEPAGAEALRRQSQVSAAVGILEYTLSNMKLSGRPAFLLSSLADAIAGFGHERVGWHPTDPGAQAVGALFRVTHPDTTTNIGRAYQREMLDIWACDPARTIEQVIEMLGRAITVLQPT